MATLTYDPSEAPEGEFTAEEQESLAVGEQLEQQQQQLLAGKFKDAEDLEKAYIELQSKLGASQEDTQDEGEEQEDPGDPEPEENFLNTLWEEAQNQDFSEETIERLKNMNPGELAKMYLDERAASAQPEATQEDAQELRNLVGGDEAYKTMITWASDNLSENEISMYDAVMDKGDPSAMYFAVEALSSRYQNANSIEGELITGKSAPQRADTFRSQAEVVRAMSDPRYDQDPAYRKDVADKLERSNINF